MIARLAPILALARSGATSRAWDAFIEAGLGGVTDDAKVLTLKGRLLKDQARAAKGEQRARLFLRAAKAYADASTLLPDSYPLINAATMSLFAGQSDHMRRLAIEVLALIQTGVGGGETAYWHEATRAEAMLLLNDVDAAKAALAGAIGHAPQAWEDHATTLRQFGQILAFQHRPDEWLSRFAPPPSLYFKGIIGIAHDDTLAATAIAEMVETTEAGFAYGALAAGADILIAEALVARGAELHVVLPVIPSVFKSRSVEPFGAHWTARFDTLFENAASVEIIDGGTVLSHAAIDIAAEVAKGRATDNAQRLHSTAIGMSVIFNGDRKLLTESHILALPRTADVSGAGDLALSSPAVWVAVAADDVTGFDFKTAVCAEQGHIIASYGDMQAAAVVLYPLHKAHPDACIAVNLLVAGDGGSADETRRARLIRMAQAAPAGTIIAGAEAAMALKAGNADIRVEPLGELSDAAGAVSLYAIAPMYLKNRILAGPQTVA